ncbi:MAG: DUF1887 family CARF protein [Mogibacterium sp.]|nr:DUF1887 family CARF protein [Mogibacterium sp.]
MILIDFLDNNVKDTLILVKSLKPSKFVLVADRDEEAIRVEGMEAACRIIAHEDGFNMDVKVVEIDPRDVSGILAAVQAELKNANGEVYINLSCENDLMTACAYNLCTRTPADEGDCATPVCVDIRANAIRNIDTLEEITEIRHLKIDDYLVAVGGKELEASRELPDESEYDAVCGVAEELFKNVYVWNMLCTYIGKHYSHDHMNIRIPADLECAEGKAKTDTIAKQLKAFCDGGILEHADGDNYRFTSEKHKGWMVVFGVWLEMYIYIKIKPYVDEVRLGLVVDWDAGDEYDTKDNEIDVVAIRNSRPIIISCKMRMPTKEDIYEIGYISDRIGGNAGKPAIATTSIVDHRESYKPGLFPRFKKMEIGLLETIELRKGDDACREAFEELF